MNTVAGVTSLGLILSIVIMVRTLRASGRLAS